MNDDCNPHGIRRPVPSTFEERLALYSACDTAEGIMRAVEALMQECAYERDSAKFDHSTLLRIYRAHFEVASVLIEKAVGKIDRTIGQRD